MATDRAPSRIPSLDGLRALSLGLVLLSHLWGTTSFPTLGMTAEVANDLGHVGVRIFFVISGFLITTLLLREHEKTGTVSLSQFYVRRTFRIFPAAWAFVAVIGTLATLGVIGLKDLDVLHAFTYTVNYHYERSWVLGHLWSLSVEEQFYLLWPALVVLARPRWIGHVAIAMVVLAPAMRVLAWFYLPYRDDVILEAYPCVMDSIATGSLVAIFRSRLDGSAGYQRFLRSPAFLVVPAVLALVMYAKGRVALQYTADITLQNLCIALIVDRLVRVRHGVAFGALNAGWVVWLGTLSYSFYLWQEPFLNPKVHTALTAWPLNLVLAFTCAVASYYLIEKPSFTARDTFARKRAAARAAARAPAVAP
jgi:peptidoglycan/LPS O-acetylase OafA/YrhL